VCEREREGEKDCAVGWLVQCVPPSLTLDLHQVLPLRGMAVLPGAGPLLTCKTDFVLRVVAHVGGSEQTVWLCADSPEDLREWERSLKLAINALPAAEAKPEGKAAASVQPVTPASTKDADTPWALCVTAYVPNLHDELRLRKGDFVRVLGQDEEGA
jgi:hypothetical protein